MDIQVGLSTINHIIVQTIQMTGINQVITLTRITIMEKVYTTPIKTITTGITRFISQHFLSRLA